MDTPEEYFTDDYFSARKAFRSACDTAGHAVTSHGIDATGPDGEELTIDSCYLGAQNSKNLLILTSGVHGVELMTGSGCQVGLLHENLLDDLPSDTGVLLIHAANPWGAAHFRRNNEDNVDLCRNFVDFKSQPERNTDYDNVKEFLPHAFSTGEQGDAARASIDAYKKEHGEAAFGRGFMAGQYHDEVGISFGGAGPVQSRGILETLWSDYGVNVKRVCGIDYHSGLGPYGYCTCVCLQEGDRIDVARRIFGEWVLAPRAATHKSDGKAPDVAGHTTDGHERVFAGKKVVSVVLEFGVKPYEYTADIMMREHRLHQDADADRDALQQVRHEMLRAFYPEDIYWRRAVYHHSLQTVEQGLNYLRKG